MSKKVIEIMKKRMSLEERKAFVKNCEVFQKSEYWYEKIYKLNLGRDYGGLFASAHSFSWYTSKEGYNYWEKIFNRFTYSERKEVINLKDL